MARRIIVILVLASALLTGIFVFSDPVYRYPYFGVHLERELAALTGKSMLTVQVSLDTGTDIVPEEELSSEPALQDNFNLLLIFSEDVQPKTESASVLYKVEEMQSEQWAWKKAELNKLQLRTDIAPRGLPTAPQITIPHPSRLADSDVWTPFVCAVWPKFPSGLLKAGKAHWSDRIAYEQQGPLGHSVKIQAQLVYRLDGFVNTSHGVFANVGVLGTLSVAPGQDPSLSVTGTLKGYALIDPQTGRTSGGDYRVEQRILAHKPGLPVARAATYQGIRFWRPSFDKALAAQPNTAAPSLEGAPKSSDRS